MVRLPVRSKAVEFRDAETRQRPACLRAEDRAEGPGPQISSREARRLGKTPGAISSGPFKSAHKFALFCAAFVAPARFLKRLSFSGFSLAVTTEKVYIAPYLSGRPRMGPRSPNQSRGDQLTRGLQERVGCVASVFSTSNEDSRCAARSQFPETGGTTAAPDALPTTHAKQVTDSHSVRTRRRTKCPGKAKP